MSLKGLIFDLDGVIVFTDQYHYKAWKQMADEKGSLLRSGDQTTGCAE